MKQSIGGWLLVATAFVACPCHLPLTLGLLVGLAGTGALGGFLTRNTGLVYAIAGAYFVVTLAVGALVLQGWRPPGMHWLSRCLVKPSNKAAPTGRAGVLGRTSHGG